MSSSFEGKRTVWKVLTHKSIMMLISAVVAISILSTSSGNNAHPNTYLLSSPEPSLKSINTKLLLLANFPDHYDLDKRQGPEGLAHCNFPGLDGQVKICELTTDNRRFPEADAVVFYSHNMSRENLAVEPIKRSGTTWSFFATDTPEISDAKFFNDPTFHNKFNSTITYRTDSDFWHGYIRSQRLSQPLTAQDREQQEKNMREAFRKKTKMAAIFLDACDVTSKRDKYVKELQKHMSVDVYGKCGKLSCENRTACDLVLEKDYKFYLSFEDNNCTDYISERLFDAMKSKWIVPVVRGGADYSKLLPQNSVVDTSKFTSPKELAKNLTTLSKDEDAWVKMLQWNYQWEVKAPVLPLCQYCRSLFDEPTSKLYPNIYEWWTKNACHPVTNV